MIREKCNFAITRVAQNRVNWVNCRLFLDLCVCVEAGGSNFSHANYTDTGCHENLSAQKGDAKYTDTGWHENLSAQKVVASHCWPDCRFTQLLTPILCVSSLNFRLQMSIPGNNQFTDCTALRRSNITQRRPMTPFLYPHGRGKGERYTCHANIPLSSHDITPLSGRADGNPDLPKKRERKKRRDAFGHSHRKQCGERFSWLIAECSHRIWPRKSIAI